MKTIKKLLAISIFAIAAFQEVQAYTGTGNETPITFDELPIVSQEWIKDNYSKISVTRAAYDSRLAHRTYEATLADNTVISFNEEGHWTGIHCTGSAVPTQFIPDNISRYVSKHYPGASVNKILNTTVQIEIELSNHQQMTFDRNYNILSSDFDSCSMIEE